MQKLIEEMNKEQEGVSKEGIEIGVQPKKEIEEKRQKRPANKGRKGDDKNVMGEGDKNVTRGVTKRAPGGVTKMSPKEDTYRRRNNSVLTLEENITYSEGKKNSINGTKKTKERVNKYFRESIFRNRIFEIYDNLEDIKSIQDLVQEGAHRACKDMLINRAKDFDKDGLNINPDKISKIARKEFPYNEMPERKSEARKFYTASICNLVSDLMSRVIEQKDS